MRVAVHQYGLVESFGAIRVPLPLRAGEASGQGLTVKAVGVSEDKSLDQGLGSEIAFGRGWGGGEYGGCIGIKPAYLGPPSPQSCTCSCSYGGRAWGGVRGTHARDIARNSGGTGVNGSIYTHMVYAKLPLTLV